MIALATLLARLLPALANFFMLSFQAWHIAAFAGAVSFVVIFLDKILLVLAWIGGQVIQVVVKVVATFLIYLMGQLPGIPTDLPSVAWENLISVFSVANRYVPVDIAFQYLGIVASIYSIILVWKLVRFIRGGA